MKLKKHNRKQGGFTLIELSIVLVIIGLIVGGVLVGQDLISAAEVRAQMSQVEKTNTAVNTFRVKYNGLPGDLSNAGTFGFSPGVDGRNGNGQIESSETALGQCGESLLFWRDLSQANLLEGAALITATDYDTGACGTTAVVSDLLPEGRIGGHITVYSQNGLNFFEVIGVDSIAADTGVVATSAALKNIDAYNIDQKLDDGAPSTGQVLAMQGGTALSTEAMNGTCREDDDNYEVAGDDATSVECGLQFRAQF